MPHLGQDGSPTEPTEDASVQTSIRYADQTNPAANGRYADHPLPVTITDRIDWQWYLITAIVPFIGQLVGLIAGIVFMARSKIGPALALWATAWLAAMVWSTLLWGVLFASAWNEVSTSAELPALTAQEVDPEDEVASGASISEADPADSDPAPAAATGEVDGSDAGTKSCGNLTVSAGSVNCDFANNVFYEYWVASEGGVRDAGVISSYSPALGRWLDLECEEAGSVTCLTEAGGEVGIPYDALAAYDQDAADEYAGSNTVSTE
jgi:hypothetical protein